MYKLNIRKMYFQKTEVLGGGGYLVIVVGGTGRGSRANILLMEAEWKGTVKASLWFCVINRANRCMEFSVLVSGLVGWCERIWRMEKNKKKIVLLLCSSPARSWCPQHPLRFLPAPAPSLHLLLLLHLFSLWIVQIQVMLTKYSLITKAS